MFSDEFLKELDGADADMLQNLISRAKYRLQTLADNPKVTSVDEFICSCLHTALKRYGFSDLFVSVALLRKVGAFKEFMVGCTNVTKVVDTYIKPSNYTERCRAVSVLVDEVVAYTLRRDVPVCMKTILWGLKNVRTIVEQAFPGYCQAGMLPFLLKQGSVSDEFDNSDSGSACRSPLLR